MTSVLRPSTLTLLKGVKASPAAFSSMGPAELFDQQTRHGRFRVLRTVDHRHAVFDPAAPFPDQTRGVYGKLEGGGRAVQGAQRRGDGSRRT